MQGHSRTIKTRPRLSVKTLTGVNRNTDAVKKLVVNDHSIDDSLEMSEQFAVKLRSKLCQVNYDSSKLINSVASRKDPDTLFKVPELTSIQVSGISPFKLMDLDNISAHFLRIGITMPAMQMQNASF